MLKLHFVTLTILLLTSCRQKSSTNNDTSIAPSKDSTAIQNPADTARNVKELIVYNRVRALKLDDLPKPVLKFIPKNYAVLDTAFADLNADGIDDLLLPLYKIGEDALNPAPRRCLRILLGQSDDTFKLDCESWTILATLDEGGMTDPYPGIIAENGQFTVQFAGGSNWKKNNIKAFVYSLRDEDWQLVKDITETYFMDKRQYESDTLTAKQIGKVFFKRKYCKKS